MATQRRPFSAFQPLFQAEKPKNSDIIRFVFGYPNILSPTRARFSSTKFGYSDIFGFSVLRAARRARFAYSAILITLIYIYFFLEKRGKYPNIRICSSKPLSHNNKRYSDIRMEFGRYPNFPSKAHFSHPKTVRRPFHPSQPKTVRPCQSIAQNPSPSQPRKPSENHSCKPNAELFRPPQPNPQEPHFTRPFLPAGPHTLVGEDFRRFSPSRTTHPLPRENPPKTKIFFSRKVSAEINTLRDAGLFLIK